METTGTSSTVKLKYGRERGMSYIKGCTDVQLDRRNETHRQSMMALAFGQSRGGSAHNAKRDSSAEDDG